MVDKTELKGYMNQYSAKLLFQWRPLRRGISRKRRVCEERIVTFSARSGKAALSKAKKIGIKGQYTERKEDGKVFFEFVGVLELKDISIGYSEGEVWYEIREMVEPMERRRNIVPNESNLDALKSSAPDNRGRLSYHWSKTR